MRFIPTTHTDREEMLKVIGVKTIDELFSPIPEELRLKRPLNLPEPKSEMEVMALLEKLAEDGERASKRTSFLGGGIYRHYIPAVIPALISRGEFLTAYTPYQPEASQGTLQALYEFQTYISMLSGMDVSNASLYDGATAMAEAVLMARRINTKGKIVYVSSAIHPHYREVLKTYLSDINVPIVELPYHRWAGKTEYDVEKIKDAICIVAGYPNYFGVIEDLKEARTVATASGGLLISVTTEALSLALLKSPGEMGVDIFVGEGQSFGLPTAFGGPLLGLIATKDAYARNLPGRLIGKGKDKDGKEAFVIVIATREQHIKREKATSNICTNEALCATMASMYLTLYGKTGLQHLAKLNVEKTIILKRKLASIREVSFPCGGTTFNEFVIRTKMNAESLLALLADQGIYGGIAIGKNDILVSVTEKNTEEEMSQFVSILWGILK